MESGQPPHQPHIVTLNTKGSNNEVDPSNLPYLHKNPAV